MPQYGYATRGEDARQTGDYFNNLGDRILNARMRVQQARRAQDVSNFIGQTEQQYSAALAADPSDENAFRAARAARARIGQLGSEPAADKAINRFDEELRYRGGRIAARPTKETVQTTQDIPLQRGGMRRIVGYGTSPDAITRYQELNLQDPSAEMTDYQKELLALRRDNNGKSKESDLTNLHLKREQLGKTINDFQKNYDAAEAKANELGVPNTTYPKDYVIAQKRKLQNELDLIKKQIISKGGTVDDGVQPQAPQKSSTGKIKLKVFGK